MNLFILGELNDLKYATMWLMSNKPDGLSLGEFIGFDLIVSIWGLFCLKIHFSHKGNLICHQLPALPTGQTKSCQELGMHNLRVFSIEFLPYH